MAKDYGLLTYLPSGGEWIMESQRFDPTTAGDSWAWWTSAAYTSATAALQVLNNMAGWEVEEVWTQTIGYQDQQLEHPMPVYLLSRPAEHPYDSDSRPAKSSTEH